MGRSRARLAADWFSKLRFNEVDQEVENTAVEDVVTQIENFDAVPAGLIVMWSGAVTAVPEGWKLCDGTNNTPNLMDRFIVGAGNTYAVGNTGGSATVTLSTSNMPSHTHSFSANTNTTGNHRHTGSTNTTGNHRHTGTTNTTGAHSHSVNATDSSGSNWYPEKGSGRNYPINTGSAGNHYHTFTSAYAGNHYHTFTSAYAGNHYHSVSGTTGSAGSGSAVENRPPYFALAYIMKV